MTTTKNQPTREIASRVLAAVDAGLVAGQGRQIPGEMCDADLSALVALTHGGTVPGARYHHEIRNGMMVDPAGNIRAKLPYATSLDSVCALIASLGCSWSRDGEGIWGVYSRKTKWSWLGETTHREQTDARKACFCLLLAHGWVLKDAP